MNSKEILTALRRRYRDSNHWVYAEELRLGTGYDSHKRRDVVMGADGHWHLVFKEVTSVEQRIDAFAMSCFPSESHRKICFEVKVSRGDFLREIAAPIKRAGALALSNQFFFVTPPGLVRLNELPDECGLMEAHGVNLRIIKHAPKRTCPEPTWGFIASLFRNVAYTAVEMHLEEDYRHRMGK